MDASAPPAGTDALHRATHVGAGGCHGAPPTHVGAGDWRVAHEELSHLARLRAGLDWEESRALLRAQRAGAHRALGYGSFGEYIERLFGYSPRWTLERLRVAEALERLPEREGEAKRAVELERARASDGEKSVEQVLRDALRALSDRAMA